MRSITNVEVSRHAYSVEHDDMLQQREAMWGRMFSDFATRTAAELNEYIADRQSSMSFRLWMACFVIETKLRSRGLREELHEVMHEQWLTLQEFLRQREVEFAATYPEDYKKHNNYFPVLREITGASDERVYKAIMADPFLRSEEGHKRYTEIAEGSWRFDGTIKDRSYITSDIPSTLLTLGSKPEHRDYHWFTLPINSRLLLTGRWGQWRLSSELQTTARTIDDTSVDLINKAIFNNAQRWVYGSSEDELIRAANLRE